MSFFGAVKNYLTDRRHLRQVILGLVGLLVLGAAILFGDDIQKLLAPPGAGRAEYEEPPGTDLVWGKIGVGTTTSRSLAQLVEVNQENQRYLYLIGGMKAQVDGNGDQRFTLINTVERAPLNADGSLAGAWEDDSVPDMYSGHAGFKAFQYSHYLYVVAGDIHIPDPDALAAGNHPLLFSTIERLDLNNPEAGWEPYTKLAGVNFFPEITLVDDRLHVVGGVYGSPFRRAITEYWQLSSRDPIIDSEGDAAKWNSKYRDISTVGTTGLGVFLPSGNLGSYIATGLAPGPSEPEPGPITEVGGTGQGPITTQQVSPDLAKALSDALLSGEFVTTVSEHYIVNVSLATPGPSVEVFAGELGINQDNTITTDYRGQPLVDTWTNYRVGHLGHLRFYIASAGTFAAGVLPVSQGRYGFALIRRDNGELLVVGGASWSNPVAFYPEETIRQTFWVIDDAIHPLSEIKITDPLLYQYVGNITYRWEEVGKRWIGTNGSQAGVLPSGDPHGDQNLSATLALKDASGAHKGRAFFGLAKTEPTPDNLVYVAVGGLESGAVMGRHTQHVAIDLTSRVEELQLTGWVSKDNLPSPAYDPGVAGLDYRVVAFGGQSEFAPGEVPLDYHYPDYSKSATNRTAMFDGTQWHNMAEIGAEGNGEANLIYPAVLTVTSTAGEAEKRMYIYRVTGSAVTADGFPNNSNAVQALGPFIYGQRGAVNVGNSEFTITPNQVAADGVAYAVATVTLRDYYDEPVVGKHVLINRSVVSGPAPTYHKIYGQDPDDIYEPSWLGGKVLKTGDDGIVKYAVSATEVGQTSLLACGLGESGFCESPALGPVDISFVNAGVPFDAQSDITAVPSRVAADGIDYSTVTVTLRDGQTYPQPVAGVKVRVVSGRNYNSDTGDYSGTTDVVTPADNTTDSDGVATFTVTSQLVGTAALHAEYEVAPGYWVTLTDVAHVNFTGVITISPDYGRQGDDLSNINITGSQTVWNDSTTVEFIEPDDVIFYAPRGDEIGNIEDLRLVANRGTTLLGVFIPDHPDSSVEVEILEGGGDLRRSGGNYIQTLPLQTNAEGKAEFEYRAPATSAVPAILKLQASITSGADRPSGVWWAVLEQADNPYQLELTANPASIDVTDLPLGSSAIRAFVYRYDKGEKTIIDDPPLLFSFYNDDPDAHMSPVTDLTNDNGIANSEYGPNTVTGAAHVFATVQLADGLWVGGKVIINKIGDGSGITIDQIDINGSTSITLGGTQNDNKFVRIGNTAKVGPWLVRVRTTGDADTSLVEEGIFIVEASGAPTAATITIEPGFSLRDRDVTLDVAGNRTTFWQDHTSLVFTPPDGDNAEEIIVNSVEVEDPYHAVAIIHVANDAESGFWNVEAVTDDERAAMTGPYDFFVADQNNYILDIIASPDRLPRDGKSQSTLTVFVGRIDPGSGQISKLSGVDVTLNKGDDNGRLNPKDNQGRTIVRTNSDGLAIATYTVDVGIENAEATITATAEPVPGIQLMNYVEIFKEVYPYPGFLVSANPPTIAASAGEYSGLEFTGVPSNTEVTFVLKGSPKGHLENNPTRFSNIAKYVVDADPVSEIVEFWGKAELPGYGLIRSNTATIEVGLDPSGYRLVSLTADPTHVPAGGAQTSAITARLTFNGAAVNGWPIDFELINGGFGDYVTLPRVKTINGNAVTTFVPGPLPANIIIRARALGLGLTKAVVVTKDVDPTIDLTRSSIWATPTHVPISNDGSKYSMVTVLLKNSNDTPLSGKTVALTSNRASDAIKRGDGTAGNSGTTDNTGRVKFRVSSTTVGTSTIKATVDGKILTTPLIFETGNLIAQRIKVVVPFQARDYDNEVLAYLKIEGSTSSADAFVNGYYIKRPRPNDELTDLNDTVLYLRPNTRYRMWVKGRYHLARLSSAIITGGTSNTDPAQAIVVNFKRSLGDPPEDTGLLVGDLLPNTRKVGSNTVALPFHDNAVNVVDLPMIYNSWFQNADIPDFLRDFIINTADWLYWFTNYGLGELGGPPPYDQRL